MSLISVSRSLPAEWMVLANLTCSSLRRPPRLSASSSREDQHAVERRAQLVRHVGEELGLVLARLLGPRHRFGERLLLHLEFLRLAFELGVGRLELGLLLVQARLARLERVALLLELLVGDAQLFLLGLQLVALPLGLGQQLAHALPERCRPDRERRRRGDPLEQVADERIGPLVERQLDDAVAVVVDGQRHQREMARRTTGQRRAHPERAGRHVLHEVPLTTIDGLPDQAVAANHTRRQDVHVDSVRRRQAKHPLVLRGIDHRGRGGERRTEDAQRATRELVDGEIALQRPQQLAVHAAQARFVLHRVARHQQTSRQPADRPDDDHAEDAVGVADAGNRPRIGDGGERRRAR